MWIFGPTINKVTIIYVVVAIAFSGFLAPHITATKTNSEAFFMTLAVLDLSYRTWKALNRDYHLFHGDSVSKGLLDNLKKLLSPWVNPFEGAQILFIPSWCISFVFIFIIRIVAA